MVLAHFALKISPPKKLPFMLLYIDTRHNFDETLKIRDVLVEKLMSTHCMKGRRYHKNLEDHLTKSSVFQMECFIVICSFRYH
ncbi:MAG: phosphoadenosine phosphosulfate reductase family protein [Flavobacteriales bacterium AspAUS03]